MFLGLLNEFLRLHGQSQRQTQRTCCAALHNISMSPEGASAACEAEVSGAFVLWLDHGSLIRRYTRCTGLRTVGDVSASSTPGMRLDRWMHERRPASKLAMPRELLAVQGCNRGDRSTAG